MVLFLALFSFSFYFGILEWLRPRDATPLSVDVEYVRTENYFGVSFRSKMQEWLQTARPIPGADPGNSSAGTVLQKPNGERILILTGGMSGPGEHDELIYCERDLRIPEGAVFNKEVYSRGKIETGAGVRLQAVAADEGIVLGFDNEVYRWVDARHKVLLRRGTAVHSRVSSMESIELEPEVSAQSLFAPLVFTAGYRPGAESAGEQQEKQGELPAPAAGKTPPAVFNGIPCSRLSAQTWLVRGDVKLPDGARIDSNLVVQGTLSSGSHCSFLGSLKARRVELGPRNRIAANVVSASVLEIGEDTSVGESVIAEHGILLRAGVRVGASGKQVVVSGGENVMIEANVAVRGKIAAGQAVIAV